MIIILINLIRTHTFSSDIHADAQRDLTLSLVFYLALLYFEEIDRVDDTSYYFIFLKKKKKKTFLYKQI